MNDYVEVNTDNGQLVYGMSLGLLETMVFTMMGYEPKEYGVMVFTDREPQDSDTLAESAPLHQEFFDSQDEAWDRVNEIVTLINEGTFEYNPPKLPEDADQF